MPRALSCRTRRKTSGPFPSQPNTFSPLLQGTNVEKVSDGYVYNAFGEHTGYVAQLNLVANAPEEVFKQSFVRDKLGRITEKTETVAGITAVYGYGYDLAGRLETVTENGTLVRTYGFDSNSNRTSLIQPSSSLTGTADDQDRQLTYGANTYTYAPNGETTTRSKLGSTHNFTYDVMGNLTALSEGSLQLNYIFDAQGRRIQRNKNGQMTHRWLYLDQLRIAAELNADGSLKQQFAYGEKINVPSLILRKGPTGDAEAYRIISDHLGSVRLVIKASDGQVMQRMRFDEYGQVLEDSNPGFQPFGYAGGLYDPDSGLVRFGARDYDSELGRWLAKDPSGFGGEDANFYNYAWLNPVNLTDPTGKKVQVCRDNSTLFSDEGSELIKHYWLETDTQSGGMGAAADGENAGNNYQVPGISTEVTDHFARPMHASRQCLTVPDADENIVNERIRPGIPLGPFIPPFNYCQSFVRDVLKDADAKEFPFTRADNPFYPLNYDPRKVLIKR